MRTPDVLSHFRSSERAPSALVGRERELAELVEGLDAAAGGGGRLILLAGEPGIGKTRLADALTALARERGAAVVWGRCWEAGGAPANWPWVQVLRALSEGLDDEALRAALGRRAAGVAALWPELRERLPDLPSASAGGEPDGARFAAWDATAAFLGTLAQDADQPLVVIVDDAHAADRPSLLFLRFLARSLHGRRLLVVATLREAEARPEAELWDQIARDGQRIALRGLGEEEIAQLATAHAGRRPPRAFARELRRLTDGNPFFALEAVRLRLAESPDHPFALPVPLPERVRGAVRRRLAPLPAGARELLGIAAVAGREIDPVRVTALAAVDAPTWDEALQAGLDLGLVEPFAGRYRFAHALVRDELYELLPAERRTALHGALAAALEDGGELAEVAYHYAAAGSPRALPFARAAGDAAAAALAFEEAAVHYERALAHAPGGMQECDLLLALGDALMRAGDRAGARKRFARAADRARELAAPERLAAAALGFGSGGDTWANGGVDQELVALVEEALATLPDEFAAGRALLLARLSDVLLYAHDWERTGALSEAAVAAARRSGEPVALMRALEARLLALLRPATYTERRELADELERLATESGLPERILGACTWQTTMALERGDRATLDRNVARFEAIAEDQRQPNMLWGARLTVAMIALMEGRLDDAERLAHEALAVAGEAVPLAAQMFGVQILGIRHEQGRLAEIEPGMRAMVAAFPMVVGWRATWAAIMIQAGLMEEGRRELELIAREDFLIAADDYEWLPSMTVMAEAFARVGDRERCALLYERLLPFEDTHIVVSVGVAYAGTVGRHLGLLAEALGDVNAAERHFERAIAAHEALGAAAYAARTRSALERMRGDAEPDPRGGGVVFARESDFWAIGDAGAPMRLRDAKGLAYVAQLLAHPGVDIAAVDLAGGGRTGDAGPALDPAAKRAYRDRMDGLRADIDEADRWNDTERASRARAELEALTTELARAVGLGGRDRPNGSSGERARVSVTKAIRTAIRRIAEKDSALAQHLDQAITTGSRCRYEPPARDTIDWRLN